MQKVERSTNTRVEPEENSFSVNSWFRRKGVRIAALSLVGAIAGGVSGCTVSEEAPTTTSPAASQETPRSIPLFADLEFSKHIGDIASYDIVCAYRKDKAIPNINPANALAYQVVSEDPYGRRGFVDPARGGLVTGSAPECTDPPYPEAPPTPPSTSQIPSRP